MMMRFTLLALILIILPLSAQAQQCGNQPVAPNRDIGQAEGFCGDSIYMRQFEYRENRINFRKMLEQRRSEYIEPALAGYSAYEAELGALNNQRRLFKEDDITSK